MRVLKGVILAMIPAVLFVGCGEFSKNEVAKVSFEKLSEKEEQILNLTDNKVFFYKVKNISKGKGSDLRQAVIHRSGFLAADILRMAIRIAEIETIDHKGSHYMIHCDIFK